MPTQQLLVGEIGITDRRDACFVALGEHAPQLGPSRPYPTGNDQCGVAEVDETDLAAVIDTPASPQFRGNAGLAAMRNLCATGCGHVMHCNRVTSTRRARPRQPREVEVAGSNPVVRSKS